MRWEDEAPHPQPYARCSRCLTAIAALDSIFCADCAQADMIEHPEGWHTSYQPGPLFYVSRWATIVEDALTHYASTRVHPEALAIDFAQDLDWVIIEVEPMPFGHGTDLVDFAFVGEGD